VTEIKSQWCVPEDSLIRRYLHQQELSQQHHGGITEGTTKKSEKEAKPIDAFGIVAAICSSSNSTNRSGMGVIGVNGKLPWGSLPSDREIFERLTRDRIMILGRKTLLNERDGNLDHVRHAKHCIVVSNSISSFDADPRIVGNEIPRSNFGNLRLARSFDEALDLARDLATGIDRKEAHVENQQSPKSPIENNHAENGIVDSDKKENPLLLLSSSTGNIQCWVAGGERLYEEALRHPSALEVHLSVVDVEIDTTSRAVKDVAMFPAKCRWEKYYELIETTHFPAESKRKANQDGKVGPRFDYRIYKRL
jgi:dihydrofolate reductase